MEASSGQDVTRLLERIRGGDEHATKELLEVAYRELRGLAGSVFRDQLADHTLQPTALVNEVCIRLMKHQGGVWSDRKHFFCAAAKAMRNLLTDHARARGALRRNGGRVAISLEAVDVPAAASEIDLVVLDETLTRLSAQDKRLGEVFELRFLVGLSVERAAEIVGVSPRSIESDTRFIRAWLQQELSR